MTFRSIAALSLSVCLWMFNVSFADDTQSITLSDAWARSSAPGAPSAGFLKIKNNSAEDDLLTAVDGDFAKKTELHRTQKVDGVMKMIHQKDGIVIPAGGMVVFKPGDYHLMFMGLSKNFEKGETYTVVLTFQNAGKIQVELPVKDAPMSGMMSH